MNKRQYKKSEKRKRWKLLNLERVYRNKRNWRKISKIRKSKYYVIGRYKKTFTTLMDYSIVLQSHSQLEKIYEGSENS